MHVVFVVVPLGSFYFCGLGRSVSSSESTNSLWKVTERIVGAFPTSAKEK